MEALETEMRRRASVDDHPQFSEESAAVVWTFRRISLLAALSLIPWLLTWSQATSFHSIQHCASQS